jgi:lipoprotein NlpD
VNAAKLALLLVLVAALAGCATRRTPAPVVDRNKKAAPARPVAAPAPTPPVIIPSSGDYYVVKRGDTLYSIALEHGADYREVAQWNQLDDPTLISIGQRLRVTPPQGHAQVSSVRVPGRLESRPLTDDPPKKDEPAKPASAAPPAPPAQPAPAAQPAVAAAASRFSWPAKGRILAEFAEPRRKGIDIDGKPGDPVVAAAAGRVTYIGTGIPGMGKLVVIKHDNGFITVYAHNREILVKEQQAVARGQKIAEIGSTDADRPKLHFQIRKGAAAVDPLLYLPKS